MICLSQLRFRVLFDVEASLNEGALTLVNAGQPCLRIIFDLKADLQKQKTDWRLELGLGALQAFGLAGQVDTTLRPRGYEALGDVHEGPEPAQ